MPLPKRRLGILIVLFILLLLALLFAKCGRKKVSDPGAPSSPAPTVETPTAEPKSAAPAVTTEARPELLTPATVVAPEQVMAGAALTVEWTGPNNLGDYVTISAPASPPTHYSDYQETKIGPRLELSAPVEPGTYEVRYVTGQSKTVLGKAQVVVAPVTATLTGPDRVELGKTVSISWTGPNNPGDYVTIVPKDTPDGRYGNYTETVKGSPLELTVPVVAGEAELRYMTGQGAKVLGRRPILITTPEVSLVAPERVIAGTKFEVKWSGPNNHGDYVTVVPSNLPDGRYANYTETSKGTPLAITALIEPGPAELRYMTGTGARVLARRSIAIDAAPITLNAADQVAAGAPVQITWSGPSNQGDYITIVPRTLPDGQYARYADTTKGSPLTVESPIEPGSAEIRYMSGQGAKVLARRLLTTVAPVVTLQGPSKAKINSAVSVTWTGPNNPGDYITIVARNAKDGAAVHTTLTAKGSPAQVTSARDAGAAEIRYMSGQGDRVLARVPLELTAE